ncbi:subtilisin-like protein [Poronia punctata]|nr:subtilisin-like protein [Poronia punctata]
MKPRSLLYATIALCHTIAECKNVLIESLVAVPHGWMRVGDANDNGLITLHIALEQPNHDVFEQTLYNVSTPQHPLYGQHLSRERVKEMVKPDKGATAAISHWLRSAGIAETNIREDGEWIHFQTTVSTAATMLDTKFGVYKHVHDEKEKIRTLGYWVPEEVRSHITMIQPTTRFGQIRPQNIHVSRVVEENDIPKLLRAAAAIQSDHLNATFCNTTITPACLRALYRIGKTRADPKALGAFGVAGFLEQYAKHDSLKSFLKQLAPYAVSQNFTTIGVNGGLNKQNDSLDDDVEANLDMQYASSIGFGQEINFYSVGGRGLLIPDLDEPDPNRVSNEPYLEFLMYLLRQPDRKLPHTLTISYGEDEQSVPKEYAKKVCSMFGQLGLRGVSVLTSSGDAGPGSACQTNDGQNTTRLLPTFPGACPYVTSVGGTIHVRPERAVAFSSGGFSDIFPRPAYQEPYVTTYIRSLGHTFENLFNPNGRGFPDVAAQGSDFVVMSRGMPRRVSGTSASAPTFASIVSLLNNARLANGGKPLGFLNPWLYTVANATLTDIVDGGSRGCTGRDIFTGLPAPFISGAGWNATEGWDPVTGLGTPLFDRLLAKVVPDSDYRLPTFP